MSTRGSTSRGQAGRTRRSVGKLPPPQGYVHPWQMTYEQFRNYTVPGLVGDSSRSPADVEELRGEGSLLSDYTGDRMTLNEFLGKYSGEPQYDKSHLADAVISGERLRIYRATDGEQEIWPGAYVTLSRQYALDHGEHNLGGTKYHVLMGYAYPDELVAMNPNEMFYVPRDLRAWHEKQVRMAVARQERERTPKAMRVPEAVRQEYGL